MFGKNVNVNSPAFIHPSAQVYGNVTIGDGASLWPYSVIRAETHEVVIGNKTNIQDFVMIHIGVSSGTYIGNYCSITHHCTLHGCTIGDNCIVGINSTIMDGCRIGKNCIIAGHTFLKEGTIIPDNSIVMGCPGEVVKQKNNYIANKVNAFLYYENALAHRQGNHQRWSQKDLLDKVALFQEELEREYKTT